MKDEPTKVILKWKDGIKDSKVEFVPDPNGRWTITKFPHNSKYFKAGIDPYVK